MPTQQSKTEAIDCAAALVTACLEEPPDRVVIQGLIREARAEGFLETLTTALAFGFAANVEALAEMTGNEPRQLWRTWCQNEAYDRGDGRPFERREDGT